MPSGVTQRQIPIRRWSVVVWQVLRPPEQVEWLRDDDVVPATVPGQ